MNSMNSIMIFSSLNPCFVKAILYSLASQNGGLAGLSINHGPYMQEGRYI